MVVFNCSEQPTTSMFVRYLFGMVRSGSWACFENVDCVEPGILSFLGEHLASIRTSMKALERIVVSQYTARGISKIDNLEVVGFCYALFFVAFQSQETEADCGLKASLSFSGPICGQKMRQYLFTSLCYCGYSHVNSL